MVSKISPKWSPTPKELGDLYTAVLNWRSSVIFSRETDAQGFPKYKAKLTRFNTKEYLLTVGPLSYSEKRYIKQGKVTGQTYLGAQVVSDKKHLNKKSKRR